MKQRTGRKLFGFLLSLALMLGLMSGMSLTALAAGTQSVPISEPITISTWDELKTALSETGKQVGEGPNNPSYYKLTQGITATGSDIAITVASGRYVVVDLNGNTINRNLLASAENGWVFNVLGNLTIKDSGSGGKITGGYSKYYHGGGVHVDKGGTFIMEGGTISNNRSADGNGQGGSVYVEAGGTFTMKNGTISENTATYGGGVYVDKGGTFTMRSGTISQNKALNTGGGGGVYVKGGTFTMESGTISKNEVPGSSGSGGGVYVDGGTFTMQSGNIIENTAHEGGGVHVNVDNSKFTMKGGTISGNKTDNDFGSMGGGVNVNSGTFTMESGTISGNTAGEAGGGVNVIFSTFNMTGGNIGGTTAAEQNTAQEGGGVHVFMGTFNMTGGSISGNTAQGNYGGGGVYLSSKATFNMSGGAISGNTAKSGGGVKVESYANTSFNLSGKVDISDNTNGNVQLVDNKVITVQGVLENTKPIGVTAEKGKDFTSGFKTKMPNADPADFFESDNSAWGVLWNRNNTEATMGPVVTVTFNSNIPSVPGTKKQNVPLQTATELRANPFTWSGHRFTGWNTKADGSGTSYADKAKVTLTEGLELYAQWKARELNVSPISDQTWTGQAITPTVTVKDGDATLTLNTDYTVAYKDNTNAGTATVTVTGAGDYKEVKAVDVKFNIVKADSSVTSAPTAKTLTYNGQAQELVTAGEASTGSTMNYAIGKDDKTAPTDGWSASIPTATNAGTYYVWYKAKGDDNHNDSQAAAVTSTIRGEISQTVTFKVVNGKWDDDTAEDKTVTLKGYEGDTLKLAANQIPAVGNKPSASYNAGSWDVTPSTETAITKPTTYTYTFTAIPTCAVTYKVVNGTWADGTTADKAETVQSGSKPAQVPTGMKPASGYTGGAWDTNPADATITGATTFTYTFTAKQPATVVTAPEARTLTYNGSAQELVTAGAAEGGTMQYALGNETAATEAFSTAIPTATDVGTWYVWYKAVGDESHSDSEAASLAVTISPAKKKAIDIAKCLIEVDDPTYTGDPVMKLVVRVMDRTTGEKLKERFDYTLAWNRKVWKIGTYELVVKGIRDYTGEKTVTFNIIPQTTRFTKLMRDKRRITLWWERRNHVTRYQIEYSLNKDFSRGKKYIIWNKDTLTRDLKYLKPETTYYVRIRTIAKANGRNYYSVWSKPKMVTTLGEADNAVTQVVEGESLDLLDGVTLPGIDGMLDGGMIDGIDGIGLDEEIELTLE